MKTNQILVRQMCNFDVFQRTCDGFFNATALKNQWNLHAQKNGYVKKKDLDDYFLLKSTKEFISVIESKEKLNTQDSAYLKEENLHGRNSAYVKSRASRGQNAGTWMHPFLFIDFAMWLNAEFKYEVLKFVYDDLIKFRNDAGDAYREMTSAIAKIVEKPFLKVFIPKVAKAINHIIFDNHESEIRNKKADELLMRELVELEKKITSLINEGFINSSDQLINYLRKLWTSKNQPKCLI